MTARVLFVALTLGMLGACGTAADHQRLPIGSACKQNGDCGTAPYLCVVPTMVNGKTLHPDGYCSLPCSAGITTDCPSDSICVLGECRRSCTAPSDCRVAEGYDCVPKDTEGAENPFCDDPNAV